MIQHEYRKIHSPVTMMMPSSDAICPRCRHVFPTMTSTQSSNTKQEESSYDRNLFTEYSTKTSVQNHTNHTEDNSLNTFTPSLTSISTSTTSTTCVSEIDIPPTPPPRLKPVLYANIPPPITSTISSTNAKPYVTMSNLNLQQNGFVTTSNQPNFIPLNSPTNYQPSIFTSNPLIKQPPPPTLSDRINDLTISNPNTRVYRQLSGGGLIQDSQNNGIRIHEAQPLHQMSGGGLINTGIDDLFHHKSSTAISLPSLGNDTKSTKLLISTTEVISPSNTSISISPLSTSSNISILVPTSLNTSLEISPNSINITVPRVTTPNKHFNNNSIFQVPIKRNTSQRQTRRTPRSGVENNQQIFFPSTISPEYLLQISKLTPPPKPAVVDDMKCLTQTINRLKESGWFHEGLSWNDSETLLTGTSNGTFVVRESSNPNFLFAITVQTKQEPTSVRIQYDNGHFRLDCVSHVTPIVPQFDCVVDLIEYYVTKHNSTTSKLKNNLVNNNNFLGNQVFVDENGQINSIVSLNKPLRSSVPSLTHCARLAINQQLRLYQNYSKHELTNILENLELPKSLKTYLLQYPYVI